MKTRNYIAVVITLVVNFLAFSANAQDAAILAGVANSKGCFHYAIFDGVFQMQNCNGWTVAPVATYSHVSYNSSESGSTSAMKFGAQVGYRFGSPFPEISIRPELSIAYITPMTIEGVKFDGYEVSGALNIDFFRHKKVSFFVAPTFSGKQIQCHEQVSSTLDIPYSGTAIMYGGKLGALIKLGTTHRQKYGIIRGKKIAYENHSQHYFKVEAGYQGGKVTEPTTSSNTGHRPTLKLNEYYASISWMVKF